jgi:hypothetical protein
MICDKNLANAVGGKTARACDSCIRKRARWYCAADDAFLCEACDLSVHTANPLASRHDRVRLKTASFKSSDGDTGPPSWHRGFTKKARTPRHGKPVMNLQTPKSEQDSARNLFPLVPEVGADETTSHEEKEEQLLYRVPIFDPFLAELCASTATSKDEAEAAAENTSASGSESKLSLANNNYGHDGENLHGCLPSDMDLAEFAADVESLLGRGFENECFGMEGLGLMDCKLEEEGSFGTTRPVKLEEEEGMEAVPAACRVDDTEIDMMREPFELNFDYDSPATCEEEAEKNGGGLSLAADDAKKKKKKKKILLNLDYEAVITAWASQGSPWASGDRPNFDPDECWPDCLVSFLFMPIHKYLYIHNFPVKIIH